MTGARSAPVRPPAFVSSPGVDLVLEDLVLELLEHDGGMAKRSALRGKIVSGDRP